MKQNSGLKSPLKKKKKGNLRYNYASWMIFSPDNIGKILNMFM